MYIQKNSLKYVYESKVIHFLNETMRRSDEKHSEQWKPPIFQPISTIIFHFHKLPCY